MTDEELRKLAERLCRLLDKNLDADLILTPHHVVDAASSAILSLIYRANLAETRLARAVEALRWLLVDAPPEGYDNACDNARTVLSELESQSLPQ